MVDGDFEGLQRICLSSCMISDHLANRRVVHSLLYSSQAFQQASILQIAAMVLCCKQWARLLVCCDEVQAMLADNQWVTCVHILEHRSYCSTGYVVLQNASFV